MTLKKKTKKKASIKKKAPKKRKIKIDFDAFNEIESKNVIKLTKVKLYILIYFLICFVCGFISYYNSLQMKYFIQTDLQSTLFAIPSFIGGYLYMENTSRDRSFIWMFLGTIGYGLLLHVSISFVVVNFFAYMFFPLFHNLLFIR